MLSNCEIIPSTVEGSYPEYAFHIKGHSMAYYPLPMFPGDVIHTDLKKNVKLDVIHGKVPNDKMVVVQSYFQKEFVARVKQVDLGEGLITFFFSNSDNNLYPDQTMRIDEIRAIALVIAVSKEDGPSSESSTLIAGLSNF